MSTTGAILTALGQGNITITWYDNLKKPIDAQQVCGSKNGSYKWSLNPLMIADLQKYSFSIDNVGYFMVRVMWDGQTFDVTSGSNTITFDLWNKGSWVPTTTAAPPGQHVGGVVLLETP